MPEDYILNETEKHPERFEALRTEIKYHQNPIEYKNNNTIGLNE